MVALMNCQTEKEESIDTHMHLIVDHVGSFLRPAALVQAREDFAAENQWLHKSEDQAIRRPRWKEIAL